MSALCKVAGLSHREEGTVRSIHRDLGVLPLLLYVKRTQMV